MNLYASTIRTLAEKYPAVIPHLTGKARWMAYAGAGDSLIVVLSQPPSYLEYRQYKTYDYFLQNLERLIRSVYNNQLGGEFIDIMANLISGQLTQAYEQAWKDEEGEGELPGYLADALETAILGQYDHVDQLYRDIVDARIDETSFEPLLARAALWAHQWDVAYKLAVELINKERGGNMIWRKGETEHGCQTCAALDGIVMSAQEWQELDVHPRGYPNSKLECEGGGPANSCDCTLNPTDQRRSPRAYNTVMNIVQKG